MVDLEELIYSRMAKRAIQGARPFYSRRLRKTLGFQPVWERSRCSICLLPARFQIERASIDPSGLLRNSSICEGQKSFIQRPSWWLLNPETSLPVKSLLVYNPTDQLFHELGAGCSINVLLSGLPFWDFVACWLKGESRRLFILAKAKFETINAGEILIRS